MARFLEAWKIAHCGTCGAGDKNLAPMVHGLGYTKAELEQARETMREWMGEAEKNGSAEFEHAAFIAITLISKEINKG